MTDNQRLIEFGAMLEREIREKGLNLSDAAALCDVPPSAITRWIQGWNMTLETIFMIEERLGIKLLTTPITVIPDNAKQHVLSLLKLKKDLARFSADLLLDPHLDTTTRQTTSFLLGKASNHVDKQLGRYSREDLQELKKEFII